jgi:hypothetical protein
MNKLTACLVLLLFATSSLFAQQITIKGIVSDTTEKKSLSNSVVALLRKSDSVLIAFTRTDNTGKFHLKTDRPGQTIMMITHPAYADYVDVLDLKADSVNELGNVAMFLKSQLLQEVVVSNNGSIRIKGDTIEYKVDSMFMKAGATVEDMLKRLPGIQVDKNGKITAQGEAVQKVLVDGEEFFSDDPTIVTRSMLSDAIDKVQVYDKKSDQAAFTGIDDGQKIKTIDLKLKADRKKGYFGKVEVGSDAKRYWNNNAMLNLFEGKRKLAFYGIMSNTGKTGLDWNESTNYGGTSFEMMEGGGMYINTVGGYDDFSSGSFYGEGLPKGWNGGIHYSNKWNADKIHVNGNYQYKKLNTKASGSTNSKYILPDTLYYINDRGNSFSSRFRNTLNGIYEYQLDSSSSIKVTANGSKGESLNFNHSLSESLNEDGLNVNSSNRRITSEAGNKGLNTNLLFRKKFKKVGRTLSISAYQNYVENLSDGLLNATYNFYDKNGQLDDTRTTDQQKKNSSINSSIYSRISYTQPLSKRAILEFNYSFNNSSGRSSITTLEKTQPGSAKYENVIDSLTNDYSLNVLTNSAGINYRYSKVKKLNLGVGANVARADFTRKDFKSNATANYNFLNFFPQANMNLQFGQSGSLYAYYNGYTRAPGIEQIQPIRDNRDELNQVIGNPDLKQSFRQSVSIGYNSYKFLSERSIGSRIQLTTTSNDFSTVNYVQPNGQRISQPVNVDGNYSLSLYSGYSKKFKKPAVRVRLHTDITKSRYTNFVNDLKNITNNNSIAVGTGFSFDKEKKYYLFLMPEVRRNFSRSSIRPDVTTKYWTQEYQVEGSLTLPKKFEFGTDVMFYIRQRTDAFPDNNNSTRWNARLDKKFLKNDAGILRFSAFDILDQNIGFDRNISTNFISERRYETFRRYFMLSFIWNFTKNGKPQQW